MNPSLHFSRPSTNAYASLQTQSALQYTFDADLENPLYFVWSELYQNDAAFFAHLNKPPVGEYLTQHTELADSFSVEVYGTVGKECREAMISTGLPIKIYEPKCRYS